MWKDIFSRKEEWTQWDENLIGQLKQIYTRDIKEFHQAIRELLERVQGQVSYELFIELNLGMEEELQECAPFIASELNRIFIQIIKKNYLKYIPPLIQLMEMAGSRELLDQLKWLISNVELNRILSTLDVYNIKKTIYTLAQRFSQKDELIYKIEMEIRDIDMDWQDEIDI